MKRRSPPAEKPRPAPVTTSTRAPRAAKASSASESCSRMPRSNAFSFSGRLSSNVATPSASARITRSFILRSVEGGRVRGARWAPWHWLHRDEGPFFSGGLRGRVLVSRLRNRLYHEGRLAGNGGRHKIHRCSGAAADVRQTPSTIESIHHDCARGNRGDCGRVVSILGRAVMRIRTPVVRIGLIPAAALVMLAV